MPSPHSPAEKLKVNRRLSSPLAVARQAVRFILASICCSTKQLKAAAAPATNQMPAVAAKITPHCGPDGKPGMAKAMPITAQKTISCTTRGLVN